MTWYANRIYVNASDEAIEALRGEPSLRGHVFLLRGSLPASWQRGSGMVVLPEAGLLVVKEIGPGDWDRGAATVAAVLEETSAPRRGEHSWYRSGEWLSWNALRGPEGLELRFPDVAELAECDVPPRAFLQYLAHLRARCGQPVTYYLGRTWAGAFLAEAAWVFAEREVLYCRRLTEEVERDPPDEVVVADAGDRRVVGDHLLRLALGHHGLHLPTAYFAPHTRGFDWEARRL
jgi:hypothetical protein